MEGKMMKRKERRKRAAIWMSAAVLIVMGTVPAFGAGWEQDDQGHWYVFDSGAAARNQMVEIDGVKYGFDGAGYMAKGWYNQDSSWYYFNPESGAQMTGWLQVDGKWYYLDPGKEGAMHKSWLKLGNNRYYLDESGAMKIGAFTVDGFYYFAEQDGSLRRNVIEKENGITIRYDDDGKEWYKNEESAVNSQNGGESWLPLLEDSQLRTQRQDIQMSNADYISEVKSDLYEEFKQDVSRSNKATARERSIEKWKDKATRKLAGLFVPQEEIDTYLQQVIDACYDGDYGTWEYEYQENGTTWTYTYYGSSYDQDDEEDYGEDYDDYDWDE